MISLDKTRLTGNLATNFMSTALTIFIKDLIVEGRHGVHPHEKENAQRFKISVELRIADSGSAVSDELEDTPDWSKLRKSIISIVQDNTYNLVERLAKEIADDVLLDQRITKVAVTIDKLDAFETGVPGVRFEADSTS